MSAASDLVPFLLRQVCRSEEKNQGEDHNLEVINIEVGSGGDLLGRESGCEMQRGEERHRGHVSI